MKCNAAVSAAVVGAPPPHMRVQDDLTTAARLPALRKTQLNSFFITSASTPLE